MQFLGFVAIYEAMDVRFFFQIAAAVFVGGFLLALYLWALWQSQKLERSGVSMFGLPLKLYLILAAVPLWVAAEIYLLN